MKFELDLSRHADVRSRARGVAAVGTFLASVSRTKLWPVRVPDGEEQSMVIETPLGANIPKHARDDVRRILQGLFDVAALSTNREKDSLAMAASDRLAELYKRFEQQSLV